ncbi:hypothetical protein LX36DRAFT_464996 [Colletotrichum falcatum]|nr:hypothetical protein LX36DRAFT_464996 [Colletotrichum falcatum]
MTRKQPFRGHRQFLLRQLQAGMPIFESFCLKTRACLFRCLMPGRWSGISRRVGCGRPSKSEVIRPKRPVLNPAPRRKPGSLPIYSNVGTCFLTPSGDIPWSRTGY